MEVYTNEIGTDEIMIRVDSSDVSQEFEKKLKDHFRAKLRVAPIVKFESSQALEKIKFPEDKRKAISFIDKRK